LTYSYSRSVILMQSIEKKNKFKNKSNFKKVLMNEMIINNKYWNKHYDSSKEKFLLHSRYDRMRYYLSNDNVKNSIQILEKNINNLSHSQIYKFLTPKIKHSFKNSLKYKLSNFETFNIIYLMTSLNKYYKACGH